MRWDMAKVLVERARTGSRKGPRGMRVALARACIDGAGPVTGRRLAALAGDRKKLNDHLAPLERYLRRQVGRPWRKVHGEIRARIDSRSAVQLHVLDHLDAFVVSRISVGRDGEWLAASGRRAGEGVDDWTAPLYVDPNDGLIKDTGKLKRKLGLDPRLRWKRRVKASPDPDRVALGKDQELRRLDGIWFRLRLGAEVPLDSSGPREILDKRQLATRELAKAGLANAPR